MGNHEYCLNCGDSDNHYKGCPNHCLQRALDAARDGNKQYAAQVNELRKTIEHLEAAIIQLSARLRGDTC